MEEAPRILLFLLRCCNVARLCDDAKKEAKIENGLEDIARTAGCVALGFGLEGQGSFDWVVITQRL